MKTLWNHIVMILLGAQSWGITILWLAGIGLIYDLTGESLGWTVLFGGALTIVMFEFDRKCIMPRVAECRKELDERYKDL